MSPAARAPRGEGLLRAELQEWLRRHWPGRAERALWWSPDAEARWRAQGRWHRRLSSGGWVFPSWPESCGGRGLGPLSELVVLEELAGRGAPFGLHHLIHAIVGPVLIEHGDEDQRRRHLPRMLRAEDLWCLAVSEEDAGSDLSRISTSALPSASGLALTGRKMWISGARRARFALVLARTRRKASTPFSFSFVIADLSAPGVRVRPIRQLHGEAGFCEVVFQDVRLPRSSLVGGLHEGWRILPSLLRHERLQAVDCALRSAEVRELALQSSRCARALGRKPSPEALQRLGRLDAEAMALRAYAARCLGSPPADLDAHACALKLRSSLLAQRIAGEALDLLPPSWRRARADRRGVRGLSWERHYLASRAETIARGASEVQLNAVARLALGLPPS